MKVNGQLFSKIFFVICFCIAVALSWTTLSIINDAVPQASVRQVELVKVNDYEPWFYQYNYKIFDKKKTIKPTKFNLPSESELLSFGNALTMFGYKFDIEDFYKNYIHISTEELNENTIIEGRLPIRTVEQIMENYIKKEELDIHYQDASILIYEDLLKVVKNNWPTIVWYIEENEIETPLNERWQISEVGLAYKIENGNIYIFNPIDRKDKIYNINKFKQYWEKCGHHAFLI